MAAPVAVVGSAGFIGTRLVAALEAAGVPVDRFTRTTPLVSAGRPVPELRRAAVVFFLASTITPAVAATSPAAVAADVGLLTNLLAALARAGDRPAFVFVSSGGTVYAPSAAAPYTESSPTGPTCRYGQAKLWMERAVRAHGGAVRPVILRPATVYGPGQVPRMAQGVIAHWLAAVLEERPLQLFGDPRTCRDFVYVDDVINAMVAVYRLVEAQRQAPSALTFNIGSGLRTPLIELLATVAETVARPFVVEFRPPRPFDRGDVWLDIGVAVLELDWRPSTSLAHGVAATWAGMHGQRSEVTGQALLRSPQTLADGRPVGVS